ncbi:hypothetical protein DFJ77DRAFT_473152 [Powellomyces hirtus]|nr:hypothetical protein DFJ77DRAFT_473152 [Powellomyces hirtus]
MPPSSSPTGPPPTARQTLPQRIGSNIKSGLRSLIINARTLPPTTGLVILISLLLQLLSFVWTSLPETGCLASRAYLHSPIISFPRLLVNHFVHVGIWHVVLNSFSWPVFAIPAEQMLGSVQFGHLIVVLAGVSSALYVLLSAFFGLMINGFARACTAGLSGLIFSLMTIEASHQRGLFERLHIGNYEIPSMAFPWIVFGISSIFFPTASFFGHMSGILAGTLYAYGMLDFLLLPARFLDVLENGRLCGCVVRWPTFIPHPAALALPTNSRDSAPSSAGAGRFGFSNPFRGGGGGASARYAPINNPIGAADDSDNDNDPLLWDEEEDDTFAAPGPQAAAATKLEIGASAPGDDDTENLIGDKP